MSDTFQRVVGLYRAIVSFVSEIGFISSKCKQFLIADDMASPGSKSDICFTNESSGRMWLAIKMLSSERAAGYLAAIYSGVR